MTSRARVAAHRARKRKGLVKAEYWVTPDVKVKLDKVFQQETKQS